MYWLFAYGLKKAQVEKIYLSSIFHWSIKLEKHKKGQKRIVISHAKR